MSAWIPPDDIDPECLELSVALNALPGIHTLESCAGHGRDPYRIWFEVTDFSQRGLVTLARCTCPRYYDSPFSIRLDHGDVHQVSFLLEAPPASYDAARELARSITEHVRREVDGYNILFDGPDAPLRDGPAFDAKDFRFRTEANWEARCEEQRTLVKQAMERLELALETARGGEELDRFMLSESKLVVTGMRDGGGRRRETTMRARSFRVTVEYDDYACIHCGATFPKQPRCPKCGA